MWRSKGRPPQRLVGVGMGSEGFDRSAGYLRLPDSYDPAASFIFEGVDGYSVEGDSVGGAVFGEFGLMGGGAAGAELDRYDIELGSPPEALLLASSVGRHSDNYQQVSEDLLETPPITGGSQSVAVRSDVVYIPLAGGGRRFFGRIHRLDRRPVARRVRQRRLTDHGQRAAPVPRRPASAGPDHLIR